MMITKHGKIVIAISMAIAVAIPLFCKKYDRTKIIYKTFHSGVGWGYDIWINKKLFIHQENIPVLSKKQGFRKENEAAQTAQIVIDKLRNNKLPTLSNAELDQICHAAE